MAAEAQSIDHRDAWNVAHHRREESNLARAYIEARQSLRDLLGQVEQARDGFGIWPYAGSESMKATMESAKAIAFANEL